MSASFFAYLRMLFVACHYATALIVFIFTPRCLMPWRLRRRHASSGQLCRRYFMFSRWLYAVAIFAASHVDAMPRRALMPPLIRHSADMLHTTVTRLRYATPRCAAYCCFSMLIDYADAIAAKIRIRRLRCVARCYYAIDVCCTFIMLLMARGVVAREERAIWSHCFIIMSLADGDMPSALRQPATHTMLRLT